MNNFGSLLAAIFAVYVHIAHGQRYTWWAAPSPTLLPTPAGQPVSSPPTALPTIIISNPTRSPTIAGSCETDESIDIVIVLHEDCLTTGSDECLIQHDFIGNIINNIAESGSDVRMALIRLNQQDEVTTVIDFDLWENYKELLDPFVSDMPCNVASETLPSDTLVEAMLMLARESDNRVQKILMINNCNPTEDVSDFCNLFPSLLEAFNVEMIVINAGPDMDDLTLYECLVDEGQENEEFFIFGQITESAFAAADETIVNQLCSANDDSDTTGSPTPSGATLAPSGPLPTGVQTPMPSKSPSENPVVPPTTTYPTLAPTSQCEEITFNLDISILVDGRCGLTDSQCDAQNGFLKDLVAYILPAGDDVRFNLIEVDSVGFPITRLTHAQSDGMSEFDLENEIDLFECAGTEDTTLLATGIVSSIMQFSGDDTERKLLILNYCPASDEATACQYATLLDDYNIDLILMNVGSNMEEDTHDCLKTTENKGISFYAADIENDIDSLLYQVSNRLCDPDNTLNTAPPVPLATQGPAFARTPGPAISTTTVPSSRAPTVGTTEEPSGTTTSEPTTRSPTVATTGTGPTGAPTTKPTTGQPTVNPTNNPTDDPTGKPTQGPTNLPTDEPTKNPTDDPTRNPTNEPTNNPTDHPTAEPTGQPSDEPSVDPTNGPTSNPSDEPTRSPTSSEPTRAPSGRPSTSPTLYPTWSDPTNYPTWFDPTKYPTWYEPTNYPTWYDPTEMPSTLPTENPTGNPTKDPTNTPTRNPTDNPTEDPTERPTGTPSEMPTTLAPVTRAPTTAEPSTAQPITRSPTTGEPTTRSPTTASPSAATANDPQTTRTITRTTRATSTASPRVWWASRGTN